MAGTDIVKPDELGIAALSADSESAELLQEALAGDKLTLGDLERIKWPTGGGVKFERTVLGNSESVDAIEGVIVHQGMSRAYFSNPEPVEGTQPDCKSPDAKFGYGDPGDKLRAKSPPLGCADCPMSQWGSHPKDGSNAQACKLTRDVFFMPKGGGMLPLVVSIPPASLPKGKGYFVELASFGIRYYTVVTRLSLVKMTNATGQPYAQARLAMTGRLDDDTCAKVAQYREAVGDAFEQAVPAADAAVDSTAEAA